MNKEKARLMEPADLEQVVELMHSYQRRIIEETNVTVKESIRTAIQSQVLDDEHTIAFVATTENQNEIEGYLSLYIGFPEMDFISPWHPILNLAENENAAKALITAAKDWVLQSGKERLEAKFESLTEDNRWLMDRPAKWFEEQNFKSVAEEHFMELILDSRPSQVPTPNGIVRKPIADINNETLEKPFFDSFLNSKDDLFLSMNAKQQKVSFDYWFNRSRSFDEDASIGLLEGNTVVGFIMVHKEDEGFSFGPIGVIPSHRGKGLAIYLIAQALSKLGEKGTIKVVLEVSVENESAINLYRKFGFHEKSSSRFFAWEV